MELFYLISIIIGCTFQNIIKKPYVQKTSGKGVYFFGFMTSIAAMVFFIITSGGFEWNNGILIYSFMFALSYAACNVFGFEALTCGSLSITTLIISYSLMVPTGYGLIFLGDPINPGLFPGLAFLVISLFLINQKSESHPVTPKWIFCVFIAFVGNGMCSVVQKAQQIAFDGGFKNEFMIIALAMVSLILGMFVVVKERKEITLFAKAGWHISIGSGLANGMVNLFVMVLSGIMPVSLMFPLISAGGIVATHIISSLFFGEKFSKKQLVGFIFGIASVVFLSI